MSQRGGVTARRAATAAPQPLDGRLLRTSRRCQMRPPVLRVPKTHQDQADDPVAS